MRTRIPMLVVAFAFVAACGGPQPTPPAPAPEPAPESEAVPDAGPAHEQTPAPVPAEPEKPALKTPENLQAAYAAETDAIARYKAFAEAADKEKYKTLALLFRASARASEVLSKNVADAITAQGGTPVAGTATPEVKKSADNVKAALAAVTAAYDTTYPGFAATAKAEENAAAERLFNALREVETVNAKQLANADKNLEAWKKTEKEIRVCTVCGVLVTMKKKDSCDVCGSDASMFEAIK